MPRKKSPRILTQPTLDDLQNEATWLEWRSLTLPSLLPTLPSEQLVSTDQTRAEFLYGARLLRLDKRPRMDGEHGPTPIMLTIADTLNAGHFMNGIMEPRRSYKTTSIQCVILGRCEHREDYQVGWTLATRGYKASERFRKDIVVHVERVYPDRKSRPFTINVGKGTEHIQWDNGAFLNVYTPTGEGFRSGGFDFGWVDEGGEASVELSEDLTVAVLPTMDTKPGAQFVVSGTAPAFQQGNLLYETLHDPTAAIQQHGVPPTIDPEELEDWEPSEEHPRARVRELVLLSHPGIPRSTPLENVQRNFEKFKAMPGKFDAEYLGIPGSEGSATGLIPAPQWERAGLDHDLPSMPKQFTLALAIHPDGLWASVGVAWKLEEVDDLVTAARKLDGLTDDRPARTAIGLLWHQQGVQGLATRVLTLARKHRVPIIYDQLSQAAGVEIETLSRATPRPTLTPATTVDVRRSATLLLKQLEEGTLVHFLKQPQMQQAASIAVKRQIGTAGGFGFGRPKGDYAADITPMEACSLALRFLDDQVKPMTPTDAVQF